LPAAGAAAGATVHPAFFARGVGHKLLHSAGPRVGKRGTGAFALGECFL
jgi:hypothetical protein